MEYDVVFNAVESYKQLKTTVIFFTLATLIPAIVIAAKEWRKFEPKAMLYEDEESWLKTYQHKIMAVWFLTVYAIVFLVFFGHANFSIQQSKERLGGGKYQSIEGQVVEIQGDFGRSSKAFTVKNTQFEYYQSGLVNPGRFDNDCKKSDCLLKGGEIIKVSYYVKSDGKNEILEILKLRESP